MKVSENELLRSRKVKIDLLRSQKTQISLLRILKLREWFIAHVQY